MRPDAYIGIDPGLTGCAVLLTDSRIEFYNFKTIQGAVNQVEHWLTQYTIKGVVLENPNVQVGKGRTVSAKFIRNIGHWEGILQSFYLPWIGVNPRSWQSRLIPKMAERDPKKRSLMVAVKMFPGLKKHLKLRKHNNRSDALLLAVFCKRKFEAPKQLNFK